MKKIHLHSFSSPIGVIRTAATEHGLAMITLPGESNREFLLDVAQKFSECEPAGCSKLNRQAEKEISRFLAGKMTRFSVSLDIRGTHFQQQVLKEVARIPYGKTRTYGDIAHAVGSPRAFRAVGSVNARNNLPLVIPCHRVVAAGGLGGYGGGLSMKKKLLRLEGSI